MPVQYDLPEYANANNVEDVNKYQKLPLYLATLEARMFPQWSVYNQLFGKINWQPNMGPNLRGVRAEPTPVGETFFYPAAISGTPNKNIYETFETYENASLAMHDFDSNQFHFLPSFQDFRENQLDFNHQDIVRQISVANDMFIRTYAWEKAPYVLIAGNIGGDVNLGTTQLIPAPVPAVGTTILSTGNIAKTQAWRQAAFAQVGSSLTLATVDYATCVLRDDLGANYFEGTLNTPKDNELIKGKYVLIGSSEAYQQFKWDNDLQRFRNVNFSIVENGFRASIFDEVTFKTERFPIRIAADGSIPAPQTWDELDNRTKPNPAYVNAPVEVAILCGADCYKSVKVGPPPRAFSNQKISMQKFYEMRWNGEVCLTDQVLVQYNNAGQVIWDTNVRGRFLKLFSSVVMGMIACKQQAYMPILFQRKRPQGAGKLVGVAI